MSENVCIQNSKSECPVALRPGVERKPRSHPYTAILNRIKSKICYNKYKIIELENAPEYKINAIGQAKHEEKIAELIKKNKELEYSRFMLKLCLKDKELINRFCELKGININVDEEIERIASSL